MKQNSGESVSTYPYIPEDSNYRWSYLYNQGLNLQERVSDRSTWRLNIHRRCLTLLCYPLDYHNVMRLYLTLSL